MNSVRKPIAKDHEVPKTVNRVKCVGKNHKISKLSPRYCIHGDYIYKSMHYICVDV